MARLRILVALGGNAISSQKSEGTAEEQFDNISRACKHLVGIIRHGHKIAITHGNGPQVGDILLKEELAKDVLPYMPLDVCVAESQGMIGYMIQQSLTNRLRREGIDRCVVTVLTQVVVDKNDKAFSNPTKPIGPFFRKEEAERFQRENGWHVVEDSHRGYRRVVASPNPLKIVEERAIKSLLETGNIVIAAGGGGIPVIQRENGDLDGVDVVSDKDLASSVLARDINAECLVMLTGVEHVYLNYRQTNERALDRLTISDAIRYLEEGHFLPGSMEPKVRAAINFLSWGGDMAIITSLDGVEEALKGRRGTRLTRS